MLKLLLAFIVCLLFTATPVVASEKPDQIEPIQLVKTIRFDHPSGLGFNYPDNWQIREQEHFMVLTPPQKAGAQPSELVLVGAEPMQGVTSLTDPAVIDWFDQQMLALLGDARRTAQPATNQLGVNLHYSTGDGRKHRVQYRSLAGLGAYVAHVGASSKYTEIVDAIFSTFGGKLALDSSLLGTWSRESVSMTDVSYSADGGSSYASSNAMFYYSFDAQNRVAYQSSAAVYAQGSSQGSTSSVSSMGDHPIDYGTYAANGSRITILWDNSNNTEWDYSLFTTNDGVPAMKLTDPESQDHKFYKRVE
jgi:hypothetical protein